MINCAAWRSRLSGRSTASNGPIVWACRWRYSAGEFSTISPDTPGNRGRTWRGLRSVSPAGGRIAAGPLVTPFPEVLVKRTGYVGLIPFDADKTASLKAFVDWLVSECARQACGRKTFVSISNSKREADPNDIRNNVRYWRLPQTRPCSTTPAQRERSMTKPTCFYFRTIRVHE